MPVQTALAQNIEFEKERVQAQQDLLDAASEVAEEFGVGIRTRAIVARDVSGAVLDVVDDEGADRLMVGWAGRRKRRDFVFGSNIDAMVQNCPVEVSLVKVRRDAVGDVVALVGAGPISPLAARQAHEIASSEPDSRLTLANVQQSDADNPDQAGTELIERVAEQAGLEEDDYEPRVVVGDEVERELLRATDGFGTVCIGASRDAAYKQALFGSIPEEIGERADANVIMVNQPYQPRTVLEALLERLGG